MVHGAAAAADAEIVGGEVQADRVEMFDDALILLEPDEIQPVDVLDTGRPSDPVEIIRMGVKMAGGFADQARDQVGLFRTRMPDGDVGLALLQVLQLVRGDDFQPAAPRGGDQDEVVDVKYYTRIRRRGAR